MDFNMILRPFKKFKDAILCLNLSNVFPKLIPNRVQLITEVINTCSDGYTDTQVRAAVDKFESILPRYQDSTGNLGSAPVPPEISSYINSREGSMSLRNLFPPQSTCCGTNLKFLKGVECMVFEINGALPGLVFVGTCNKCKTVYDVSHIIRKGKKLYYANTDEIKYFRSTRDTVFERELLSIVDRDL